VNTKAVSTQLIDSLTLDFARFYHLLLFRAWVIILFFILSLFAVIAYLMWVPKIYQSRAVIAVEQENVKLRRGTRPIDGVVDDKDPQRAKQMVFSQDGEGLCGCDLKGPESVACNAPEPARDSIRAQ
jgi:uncharacterized membrane protein